MLGGIGWLLLGEKNMKTRTWFAVLAAMVVSISGVGCRGIIGNHAEIGPFAYEAVQDGRVVFNDTRDLTMVIVLNGKAVGQPVPPGCTMVIPTSNVFANSTLNVSLIAKFYDRDGGYLGSVDGSYATWGYDRGLRTWPVKYSGH